MKWRWLVSKFMNEQILKNISEIRWLNRWAGSYTFISCSYWGSQYYHSLKKYLGVYFKHTLFIHRNGTVSFFIPEKEFKSLGKYLSNKSQKDKKFAIKYCTELKKNTDKLLPLMKKIQHGIPSWAEYKQFNEVFDKHLPFHVFVKKTIDFLLPESLKKLLPYFKDARLYSEMIYSDSENFFRNIMKAIAKKEGYNSDYLTCLTQKELETYLQTMVLPPEVQLKGRFKKSVLYFESGKINLFLGSVVDKIDNLILKQSISSKKELRGISAYPGWVVGKARIILDPHKVKNFNQGDILIAGMTRPEFLPLVKKASAIVTDVGGVLCHAAITAREMKIPCVVGTAVATKIFKDGQILEVWADKGIVKAK